MSYVVVGCQAVVAVTFAASAASKLRGRAEFRRTVTAAARVPRYWAGLVATAVVTAEATTAVAVVAFAPAGFALAVLLLVALTGVIVSMIRRRVRVPCRCFGTDERPPGVAHLLRNAILLAIAATGGTLALTGAGPRAAVPASGLAAVAGATVALLLINLETIAALAGPAVRG